VNDMAPVIPEALLAGRRALDGLERVTILDDWQWADGRWVLRLRLRTRTASPELVPEHTNWYVTADPMYPAGEVEFLPDEEGGMIVTFPHQRHNSVGRPGVPWRNGKICVSAPLAFSSDNDLYLSRDPDVRLYGYCLRALEWLDRASRG
jgi:hypothetical protein